MSFMDIIKQEAIVDISFAFALAFIIMFTVRLFFDKWPHSNKIFIISFVALLAPFTTVYNALNILIIENVGYNNVGLTLLIKVIITLSIIIVSLHYSYSLKIKHKVIISIGIYIAIILADYTIFRIPEFMELFNHEMPIWSSIAAGMRILSTILGTIIIAFYILCAYFVRWLYKMAESKEFRLNKRIVFVIYLICSFLFLSVLINESILNASFSYTNKLYTIPIIIFFSIATIYLLLSNKLFNLGVENEGLKTYIDVIDDQNGDLRRFRHNYLNILTTLYGYMTVKDYEGLDAYFQQVLGQINGVKNLNLSSLPDIKYIPIKTLVAVKSRRCEELGIKFEVFADKNIEIKHIELCDLCEILGVFLDNAIEECAKMTDGTAKVFFGLERGKGYVSVIVENPCAEQVNIDELYKLGKSTKGKDRGIGLYSVSRILERYKTNVMLFTRMEKRKNLFIQELQIKSN